MTQFTGALDYAKFVFALLIVSIHVPFFSSRCFGGMDGTLNFYFAWGCLVRIAVPGFFAITAFLFARSIDGFASARTQLSRLVHVERRLLLLWLIWAVPNIPVSLFHAFYMMDSPPANLFSLDHFLWGGGYTVAWFLVATMMALPLAWIFHWRGPRTFAWFLWVFFYLLCLAERPYSGVCPPCITHFVEWWKMNISSPVFSFAIAYPFLAIGMSAWRFHVNGVRTPWIPAALFLAVLFAEAFLCRNVLPPPADTRVDQNPIYFSLAPFVFFLLLWLVRLNVPCNRTMRSLSIAIMMSHVSYRTFFNGLAHWGVFPNSLTLYAMVIGLSIATGCLLLCISRYRGFGWLRYAL